MNLRMIGLTAAVVCGCLVPLVASAHPAVAPDAVSADPFAGKSSVGPTESHRPKVSDRLSGEDGAALSSGLPKSPSGMSAEAGSLPESDRSGEAALGRSGAAARCGPELVAPEGVEAQTCVMTRSGTVWARVYFRNTTGEELRSVLTLLGPGGRTVELHCAPAAHDEPGSCETPGVPSSGAPGTATAVAEFTGAGPAEEAPLLLRAGSERAPVAGGAEGRARGCHGAGRSRKRGRPVAGDGGCTSDRASRTVTRDLLFANSISPVGTRIYLRVR
ncbi:hypothetical protein A3Q37_02320 [Streptomyces sp. PTY087I2]|nr:hypothetical protein A3Q37_02320 [Streptomyces sp. PTY087I2]